MKRQSVQRARSFAACLLQLALMVARQNKRGAVNTRSREKSSTSIKSHLARRYARASPDAARQCALHTPNTAINPNSSRAAGVVKRSGEHCNVAKGAHPSVVPLVLLYVRQVVQEIDKGAAQGVLKLAHVLRDAAARQERQTIGSRRFRMATGVAGSTRCSWQRRRSSSSKHN